MATARVRIGLLCHIIAESVSSPLRRFACLPSKHQVLLVWGDNVCTTLCHCYSSTTPSFCTGCFSIHVHTHIYPPTCHIATTPGQLAPALQRTLVRRHYLLHVWPHTHTPCLRSFLASTWRCLRSLWIFLASTFSIPYPPHFNIAFFVLAAPSILLGSLSVKTPSPHLLLVPLRVPVRPGRVWQFSDSGDWDFNWYFVIFWYGIL
ncbi:hypothetical protein C8F04DRAFT_1403393 [Mycena alexandri]|uniref:Uncharacterized protein n=1 Tax=Mycena alexandri TaxID=1745969 RepID=A0AAD6S4J3_9AGAR|nr:hypothetical protein C8F04DRAFT_1403393 [Mycena alexandri]